MTVPATPRRVGPFYGNGVTTSFPFNFKCFTVDDFALTLTDANGNPSSLVRGTDYNVTLNADQASAPGGTITYPISGSPMASGYTLTGVGTLAYDQTTSFPQGGSYRAVSHENAFDRTVNQLQQIAEKTDRAITLPVTDVGVAVTLPNAANRANRILGFDANGNVIATLPTAGDATNLALDLANSTSASKGAGQLAYDGARNYVGRTIGARLLDVGASPRSFGATGDGVADDTSYITAALLYSKTLDLRNRSWKITSTIELPAGCVVDLRGASVVAATGSTPLFSFRGAKEQLLIQGGGGYVTGTASAFLFCEGTSYTPSSAGEYARQIRLQSVHVTSPTISNFLVLDKACRQIFLDSCMAYTPNGIYADGKHVEFYAHKTIIYSATGAAGTYGVKLRSQGGGIKYNEGWEFTECLVDNFATSLDITDIFQMNWIGGFLGCVAGTGFAAIFGQPTSNLCADIKFVGAPIAGPVRFAPSGGLDYAATFVGCTSLNTAGVNIQLANNAAGVSIRSHKFKSSTNGVAVEMVSNNSNCVVAGIDCDSTFISGVQVKGPNGDNVEVGPLNYSGTNDPVYIERPVRLHGIPVTSTAVSSYKRTYNPSSLNGSYAVGVNIASITVSCAKGESGVIDVALPYSGANAATQRIDIAAPSGMVLPSGTGWTAAAIMLDAASGHLSARIPYHCSQSIAGQPLTLKNAVGNTLAVDFHARFGIDRDW